MRKANYKQKNSVMKQTGELFAKEMTRREFLQLIAVALLSSFGIANFFKQLLAASRGQTQRQVARSAPNGFGSRTFGS